MWERLKLRRIWHNRFLQDTTLLGALRMGSLGLSFILNLVLANLLGAAQYGIYTYALSWLGLLGVIAIFGLDRLTLRETAILYSRADWPRLRTLVRFALGLSLILSLATGCLLFGGREAIERLGERPPWSAGVWLLLAVLTPLLALSSIQETILRGLHRLLLSQLPRFLLQPLAMLAALGAWFLLTGGLTAEQALGAYALGLAAALLAGGGAIWQIFRKNGRPAAAAGQYRSWLTGGWHLFIIAAIGMLNGQIDVYLLGFLADVEMVGIYAAALRGAALISLGLSLAVVTISPAFAGHYAAGKTAALEQAVRQATRLGLLTGLPVAAAMIIGGRWFLGLFGPAFVTGHVALILLTAGQLVNITCGPVAALLTMTGHERDVVIGLGASLLTGLLMGLALIPVWGINGAAAASAGGLAAWNLILLAFGRRRLGLSLPLLRKSKPADEGLNF